MSRIDETEVGFFVATHEGRKLAGPYADKPEAYYGREKVLPLTVRKGKYGFFVENEDTGEQVSGFFKRDVEAIAERERQSPTIKGPFAKPQKKQAKAAA